MATPVPVLYKALSERVRDTKKVGELPPYETPTNTKSFENVVGMKSWLSRVFRASVEATPLGSGTSGAVFLVHMTTKARNNVLKWIDEDDRKKHKFAKYTGYGSRKNIPSSGTVAVKLVPLTNSGKPLKTAFAEFKREVKALEHINLLDHVVSYGSSQRIYRGKRIAPEFYFSYYDTIAGFGLIFSEYIQGISLYDYLQKLQGGGIPAWVVAELEYAICCMFLSGFIHGDLHMNNIILDPKTKRLHVIDFGRSIPIPHPLQIKFEDYLKRYKTDAIYKFWEDEAQRVGNSAVRARKTMHDRNAPSRWWTDVQIARAMADDVNSVPNFQRQRHDSWSF